jgi:GAF domain-containing protein/CheY-like chemotaxis protein
MMSKRVLVVYDEDDLRDSLCKCLHEAGYDVEGVSSGEQAIQAVRQVEGKVDFVLMDQVLIGRVDGLEATRIIRHDYPAKEYPDLRIIVLTQYGDGESSRRALDAGAYRYVFRPCPDQEIVNLLRYSESLAKLERGLKEAESVPWMQAISAEAEIAISIIDRTYRVLYANTKQKELAGRHYRDGGICWVEFYQAYHQKEPCVWCPVKPLFETGKTVRKTAVLFKHGQAQYYEAGASPIFDEDSQTILAARKWGVEVTAREVLDRRTLEAATLDERLDAVLERIRMLGYSRVRLYELSEDGQFLIGRKGRGGTNVSFTEIRLAVKDDRYSQITLASYVPRIHKAGQHGPTQLDYELDRVGLEEWLDVPLCTSDGEIVGKVTIDNKLIGPVRPDREPRPEPITEEHFELLTKIATFAANAIAWERDRRQIKREAERLRELRAIDADIASELGVMAVVRRTLAATLDLTGATSGHLRLRDGDRLIKVAGIGPHSEVIEQELSISAHRDVPSVQAMLEGKPHIAKDAQQDRYTLEWMRKTADPDKRRVIESIGSFATFPLQFEEETIGVLSLQSERKDFFTSEICALVEDVRQRAARALRNAQLYERRIRETEALRKVDEAVLSAIELEKQLQVILEGLFTLIPCECALIRLFDEESQELELRAFKGEYPGEIPKRKKMRVGISGLAAQEKQTILENDVTQNPAHQRAVQECTNEKEKEFLNWIRAEVAIPLTIGEKLIGVLCLQKVETGGFLEADIPQMKDFAGRVAIAIENAKLRQQLERRVEQLRSMSLVATRIQSTTDPDATLRLALTGVTAKQGLRFSRAMLFLANEDKTMLRGKMAVGAVTYEEADRIWNEVEDKEFTLEDHLDRAEKLGEELNKPLNELVRKIVIPILEQSGAPALCLLQKEAIIISDARTDPLTNRQLVESLGMTTFAAVPLIAKGEFVGTLVVDNRFLPKETIDEEGVRVLETFAGQAAMIIESARLRDELVDAWRVFSASATHGTSSHVRDMRGALTRLTDAIKRGGELKEVQPFLDRLEKDIYRMQIQVRKFVELAQPRKLELQTLNANAQIIEALQLSGIQEEGVIEVILQLADDLPNIRGDKQALVSAFLELIENARYEILQSDRPEKKLELYSLYEPPYIRLEFADSGRGVLPQYKKKIFEPAFTTREESAGIGLPIVKYWIEQHGGTIREIGIYREGARFEVILPADLKRTQGGNEK